MTSSTRARLPQHLRRYTVAQDYSRYTPEDQATWRFVMRQLRHFLDPNAYDGYRAGLQQTGIATDTIPHIERIDEALEKWGWGAVPVSGFIPPAAFMEFQALGILPIASDMRTLEHLQYTPAPDIVHEAAGHAPFLANREYSAYLRQYGEVARNSINSKEDFAQYEAIRYLSDLKENPHSTAAEIAQAESRLTALNNSMTGVSEAALLSRMNWWTAEYGLIGTMQRPKIFGAGLLSSVGESRHCLSERVKKIPLTVNCVDFSYDITEPQPQLFVCESFSHLSQVLGEFSPRLSYRRGGVFGLNTAIAAGTVNSVQLNSGIQISGVLTKFLPTANGEPAYLHFSGPCQLGVQNRELKGQSTAHHAQGFSTPVGTIAGQNRCLSTFSPDNLARLGIRQGQRASLEFASGVRVEGEILNWTYAGTVLTVLSWKDCRVQWGDVMLYDPAWGTFDMAVGNQVISVFGGPADRTCFNVDQDFASSRVPTKAFSAAQKKRQQQFQELRERRHKKDGPILAPMIAAYVSEPAPDWLQGIELLELSHHQYCAPLLREKLLAVLQRTAANSAHFSECIQDGINLAAQ